MRRHDLDWTSLIAGLVVTAVGAAYLIGAWTDLRLDGRWILPLALIGLGLAGLAGGITAARRPVAATATAAAAPVTVVPTAAPDDLTTMVDPVDTAVLADPSTGGPTPDGSDRAPGAAG